MVIDLVGKSWLHPCVPNKRIRKTKAEVGRNILENLFFFFIEITSISLLPKLEKLTDMDGHKNPDCHLA